MAKFELVPVSLTADDLKPAGRQKSADTVALEQIIRDFHGGKDAVQGIPYAGDLSKFRTRVYNIIRTMDGGDYRGKVVPSINEKVPGTLILSRTVAKPTTTPKKRTAKV